MSQTKRILEFIANSNGVTFTQIQRELFGYTHTRSFTRQDRGWWCTNLLGSPMNHEGLLHVFCEKRDGKWHRNNVQHGVHPWKCIPRWRPSKKSPTSVK
jgi:hypothetical protein